MPSIRIAVDGSDDPIDVELALGAMTLREAARFEEQIGTRQFDEIMQTMTIPPSPRVMIALIWSKLVTKMPDLDVDDFDLDLSDLVGFLTPEGDEGKASAAE